MRTRGLTFRRRESGYIGITLILMGGALVRAADTPTGGAAALVSVVPARYPGAVAFTVNWPVLLKITPTESKDSPT